MSFDQQNADDRRGTEHTGNTGGSDTTGRIYGADDHTAHLPAHPRPQASHGDQSYGDQSQQPHRQQNGPYAAPVGAGQQSSQRPYGAPGQNPYAAPSYHQGGGPGGFSGGPYQPGGNGSGGQDGPKRSRRWAAVPVAAVLAAALASGGTWALTHDGSSAAAGSSSTTVVQANPADFANAGTVDWSATAAKVAPSVVAITVRSGASGDQGSGVILDKDGNIVTNNHVVSGAGPNPTVTVTLNNNRTYEAKVVGTDPSTDLAVVKLKNPPSDLTPITLGDDKSLVVGQPVMAVGNPLGLAGTVTTGIVSALNRPVTTQQESPGGGNNPFGGGQKQENSSTTNAIQTSAAINPGNSGGALVNGSGKLIGINSSIATLGQSSGSSQSGNIGIGFAIPVSVVKNITSQLMEHGKVRHAQIGVTVSATPATVKVGNATVQAAKIVSVNAGSPAAKAGIKKGDDVIKFNGHQVSSSDALIGFVRAHNVGDKITLTIVRDGKQQDVTVTLGEASSS